MSRYFQSSYHGSNDYKKYREERINKPANFQRSHQLGSYQTSRVSKQHSPLRTKLGQKQHLQTFGKLQNDQESRQSSRQSCIRDSSTTDQKTFLQKYNIDSEYSLDYDSKIQRYTKERYSKNFPSLSRKQESNFKRELEKDNLINEEDLNTRPYRTKQASFQEKLKDYNNSDNFEDSIISRRGKYGQSFFDGNLKMNRVQKLYQNSTDFKNKNTKDLGYQQCRQYDKFTHIEKNYQRPNQERNEKTTKSTTSPYQNRNQMIRKRIDLNQNQRSDWRIEVNVKNSLSIDIQATNDYGLKYKTAQVTPEKCSMTPRDDRNASEQRRKSLIQKSQMLKQKLSKLNPSSNTKPAQNQESGCEKSLRQNMNLNYTPRRYPLGSYQPVNQQSDNMDRNVSKKLNFEQDSYPAKENPRYQDLSHKQNRQLNSKALMNENGSSLSQNNTEHLASRNYALSLRGQSGEGALKKITELNDRINSRLESILKNYS